jgi:glycosyltransferase involved in cell wall biosynthesis
LLGTHIPRRCGIASFTADLAQNLVDAEAGLRVDAIAMTNGHSYDYPERVRFQIADQQPDQYRAAAEFINQGSYDVLSVQHEYGIFGGEAGEYLLHLVREAKMPIVTTLHTVLREPSAAQKNVLGELLQLSERIVVMSTRAIELLQEVHDVAPEKIDFIPHGIPTIPEHSDGALRARLGVSGPMILTFGLLSPDKGIEFVIQAMPAILAEIPDATYVVVGATHPNVKAGSGERYREQLVALAAELGVADHVVFVNEYVPIEELVEYLAAMDIYITPYLNPNQITSGTLAYAVGAGRAVVSTPYTYAEELLSEGRGMLVPYRDASAIAAAVTRIQVNEDERRTMERRAAEFGDSMRWPKVGRRYLECFNQALEDSSLRMKTIVRRAVAKPGVEPSWALPNFHHLCEMTDDTGLMQHAIYTVPRRSEGYCVDDNARALWLTARLEAQAGLSPEIFSMQGTYLSFVIDAFNPENRRFRNFMSYSRTWLERSGSEDSQGRSLWGLGTLIRYTRNVDRRNAAQSIFVQAAPGMIDTTSPRTWAYAVLALDEYLEAFPNNHAMRQLFVTMAMRLMHVAEQNSSADWPWFEQSLSYANARLPQALLIAGQSLANPSMIGTGLRALNWLMRLQTGPGGVFMPIGSEGFYARDGIRADFDQQPLEAWASVSACLSAQSVTDELVWNAEANRAYEWFIGKNVLGIPLYDSSSGGCNDGLHSGRINGNQGAESTLSYLCALIELQQWKRVERSVIPVGSHEIN